MLMPAIIGKNSLTGNPVGGDLRPRARPGKAAAPPAGPPRPFMIMGRDLGGPSRGCWARPPRIPCRYAPRPRPAPDDARVHVRFVSDQAAAEAGDRPQDRGICPAVPPATRDL